MARIPTKQMEQAVDKIYKNENIDVVYFGTYKEHTLKHTRTINNTNVWEYEHYNTLCCRVVFENGRKKIRVSIGSRCWSMTDSNNINGLLYCLEVPRVRVYNHNDIRLKIDGNKTSYTQIVIEGEYV